MKFKTADVIRVTTTALFGLFLVSQGFNLLTWQFYAASVLYFAYAISFAESVK